MKQWYVYFLKFFAFGLGIGMVSSIAISLWHYSSTRPQTPKPWRDAEITASFDKITIYPEDHITVIFNYVIQNNTKYDYHLPNDSNSIFKILPAGKGLAKNNDIIWQKGLYIPLGQKVNTEIKVAYDYDQTLTPALKSDVKKLEQSLNKFLKELDGFTILDSTKRYKINFPNGWQENQK